MELIDKRKTVESLERIATALEDNGSNVSAVITQLNAVWVMSQPTIKAEPVLHGQWKYYHKKNIAVCTNCSFGRNLDINFGKAITCPNCGAKMDGGNPNERITFDLYA